MPFAPLPTPRLARRKLAILLAAACLSLAVSAPADTPIRRSGISGVRPGDESVLPGDIVGELSYLWSGTAGFDTVPGAALRNEEFLFTFPVPLHVDENMILSTGLYYRWNHMEFSGVPFLPRDLDLHQVYLPFNLLYTHDERWSFWFFLAPGVVSDFVDIDSDAFDLAMRVVALYKHSERVTYVAGLSNSREYGEEQVTPIFGSIWNLGPQWRARLTFPRPSIGFAPREGTLLTLTARPGGGSWSFFNPSVGRNSDLDYSSIRLGLSGEQKVGKLGWAFLEGGYQLAQELEVQPQVPEYDLDGTWYLSTGLRLRF